MDTLISKESRTLKFYMRALAAVCLKGNLAYYYTLYAQGGVREGFLGRRMTANRLKEKWGITNAQTLKHNLGWLLEGGSRQEFNEICYLLSALSESDRVAYIDSFPKEHDQHAKLFIANYYMRRLPVDGIAAFDYAWYIYLCQVGRTLRYLSEKEARQRMIQVAQRIQQSYSGWNEYIAAYVAGSQFIAKDTSFSFVKMNHSYITKLFTAENSPFRKVDWDIDLPVLTSK